LLVTVTMQAVGERAPAVAGRPWLLVCLVLAAFVHIVSILAMPQLAPRDAFRRLAALGAANQFHPLPRAAPGAELFPFNDPAVATGVCVYDLKNGPLHLRAKLIGDSFVSLSFHTRHGVLFYALTDKAATRQAFDIYVVTADQLAAMQARDSEDEPPQELRVVSSSRKGFVFARALSPQPSAFDDARGQIRAVTCGIEPIAPVPAS
jgi:uncharacterized membrane protein